MSNSRSGKGFNPRKAFFVFGTLTVTGAVIVVACGQSTTSVSSGTTSNTTTSSRTLLGLLSTAATIATSFNGSNTGSCTKVTRDTSSCQSARTALGLSGDWLSFSCNVVLGVANASKVAMTTITGATYVTVTYKGLPDHQSNYYPTTGTYSFTANSATVSGNYSDMHKTYTTYFTNPNTIASTSVVMYIPITPSSSTHATMGMGTVGVSVDGVPIYNSLASSTDNIFAEAGSFDECQGHPDSSSTYHYHSEPYGTSYADSNLIGVMRDGYFIYGRYDHNSTTDLTLSSNSAMNGSGNAYAYELYRYGGHIGASPVDGTGSYFHYHATKAKGCFHRNSSVGSPRVMTDDGVQTIDGSNPCTITYTDPMGEVSSTGIAVPAYFLTGHGNGGTFMTVPTTSNTTIINGATMLNNTAATRYYYGSVAGDCTGC